MAKNTMTDMVVELEKLATPFKQKLIDTAKTGQFHDYRSKAVCGKMYAVECLQWLGLQPGISHTDMLKIKAIHRDIVDGVYDEDLTDEDKKLLLAETEADPNLSQENKEFFINAMGLRNTKQ